MAVLGEPGIGKSRLAREAAARLGTGGDGARGPLPALRRGDHLLAGAGDGPQARRAAARGADRRARRRGAVAASVGGTLGLGDGARARRRPGPSGGCSPRSRSDRPLVLVFEDTHWAEPPLLDLVDHLAARLDDAPVLLLCLARPELLAARPAWAGGAAIPPAAGSAQRRREPPAARRPRRALGGPADRDRGARRRQPAVPRAAGRARRRARRAVAAATGAARAARRAARPARRHPSARCSTPPRSRESASISAVCSPSPTTRRGRAPRRRSTDWWNASCCSSRRRRSPASMPGASATRSSTTRPTRRCRRPCGPTGTSASRTGSAIEAVVPEADALIGSHLERAHRAAADLGPARPRLEALAARAAGRLAAAGNSAHRRGDLPSEIAFLSRAAELLAADEHARAELLPALAAALFEAGSLERGGGRGGGARARVASACRASTGGRPLRSSGSALPPSRDGRSGCLAGRRRRCDRALDRLGDDLGLARAHYLSCELVWLQGSSEPATERGARSCTARRAGSGFEIDTGVSYMAWALVVNEIPVSRAIRRCDQLERAVAGRFAALSVRGFRAVLDAMAGRFALSRRSSRPPAPASPSSASTRRPCGWRSTTRRRRCWRATPLPPNGRSRTPSGSRSRSATAGSSRRSSSTARTPFSPGRRGAAAEAVAAIDSVPAPNDIEWQVKRHAARGKLAALEGDDRRARRGARLRPPSPTRPRCSPSALTRTATSRGGRAVGRREDAGRATATALALYAAKENVAGAAQVRPALHPAAPSPRDGA